MYAAQTDLAARLLVTVVVDVPKFRVSPDGNHALCSLIQN
jgi:hypothetical protein